MKTGLNPMVSSTAAVQRTASELPARALDRASASAKILRASITRSN
jgi:hypothetical protein